MKNGDPPIKRGEGWGFDVLMPFIHFSADDEIFEAYKHLLLPSHIVLTIERRSMSSSAEHEDREEVEEGEEEGPLTMNWELLAASLDPDTLAALKAHCNHEDKTPLTTATISRNGDVVTQMVSNNEAEQPHRKFGVNAPNSVFKLHSYWEDRFTTEEEYDWLVKWNQVSAHMVPYLKKTDKILMVGCGNSTFSADLYDAGYEHIVNIDFSQTVIDKMQQMHQEKRPNMTWLVMDMTAMTFADEEFDVVIDKAAMDALVVDEGDVWDPKVEVIESVDKMCHCVNRVLNKIHGIALQISFAQPHFRTKYLMGYRAENTECNAFESHRGRAPRYDWTLSFDTIEVEGGCLSTYLFIMQR